MEKQITKPVGEYSQKVEEMINNIWKEGFIRFETGGFTTGTPDMCKQFLSDLAKKYSEIRLKNPKTDKINALTVAINETTTMSNPNYVDLGHKVILRPQFKEYGIFTKDIKNYLTI